MDQLRAVRLDDEAEGREGRSRPHCFCDPAHGRGLCGEHAGSYLGVSEKTLERIADRQGVRSYRVGALRRYLREDLDAFLDRLKVRGDFAIDGAHAPVLHAASRAQHGGESIQVARRRGALVRVSRRDGAGRDTTATA